MIKLFLLIFLSFISCNSTEIKADEWKTIIYKPTQCSEPWDEPIYTDGGNLSRVERFKNYLKDNEIVEILDFKNTKDEKVNCSACNCPSQDNFSFKVSPSSFEKLKSIEPFKLFLKK